MNIVTQIHVLDKADTLDKGMNPTIRPPAMDKYRQIS